MSKDVRPGSGADPFVMLHLETVDALAGDSALHVYIALRRHVTRERRTWFIKRSELAKEAGVSEGTVKRSLPKLEELGLIEIRPRYVPADWNKKDSSKIRHTYSKDTPIQVANLFVVYDMPNRINAGRTGDQIDPHPGVKMIPTGDQIDTTDIDPLEEDPREGAAPSHEPPAVFDGLDALAAAHANGTLETYPDHCPAHRHISNPPACRACRDTREANEARAEATKQADDARKHEQDQHRRAGIKTCNTCDSNGYRPYINPRTGVEGETLCHHTSQDHAEARAAKTTTAHHQYRNVS